MRLYRLNEQNNRDCDYIISVNFVTFLILWKIGKHQESKRYLEINRKLIELLLDEDPSLKPIDNDEGSSSLSVIMESSHQTFNRQSLGSIEGEDQQQQPREFEKKKKIDRRILKVILASDSEDDRSNALGQDEQEGIPKKVVSPYSRLS